MTSSDKFRTQLNVACKVMDAIAYHSSLSFVGASMRSYSFNNNTEQYSVFKTTSEYCTVFCNEAPLRDAKTLNNAPIV